MDEIHTRARSSNQVGKGESTRLLRFRLVLGEDARTFRSKSKMGQTKRRLSTVQFLQRINYLELMEKRLSSSGNFPRTYFIGDPPEESKIHGRSKH